MGSLIFEDKKLYSLFDVSIFCFPLVSPFPSIFVEENNPSEGNNMSEKSELTAFIQAFDLKHRGILLYTTL